MSKFVPASAVLLLSFIVAASDARAAEPWQFGFSKLDITPTEPVRLSGYGNRAKPSEGVEQKLWVRAMVLKAGDQAPLALVSADSIGFPGSLTTRIARTVEEQHGIPRNRFVLSATHSHTAPHIGAGLTNIFAEPLSEEESAAADRYTELFARQIVAAVGQALESLAPGRMYLGEGKAGFAANRRVLADGKWKGFGVTPGAPVDHSLPVLKITDVEGRLRGLVLNYACHCTTLGPDFNRVCGDWAGYASEYLEETSEGAVALTVIGCGADANPEPRGKLEMAQAHGRAAALAVGEVLKGEMREITAPPTPSFGYAGLPSDRPSVEELKQKLEDKTPQVRRHAENMLEIHKRMGRLPETYPMPIQTWQFGDQLTMVFLGGEVVVDFAHRLKRDIKDAGYVWVTAYANDVFGYVASERVRREGGYEVEYSMIYYNQPSPWSAGTEELVIQRTLEILENPQGEGAVSAADALKSFTLPEGFEIELVAAEPLIADPVSFAFGPDGRLWVVEMADYPRGVGEDGRPGGRVRVLEDTDGDGRFDETTLFLDGIFYPTGVLPWDNGVLVSCAPEIIFAEDTNGDGKADTRKVLFTGFVEANPQHRINGFTYGLDNWLYLGSGAASGDIRSEITGDVVNMSGRDIRIRPDEGILDPVSGAAQYGRSCDDWGNWFANNNSRPLWHYVISDRYLRRNLHVPSPVPRVELLGSAPPVYPTSRTVDRFNDLYAANRFTSACSPMIFRDMTLGEDVYGAAFICEPVHNLVHRSLLKEDGPTFQAFRHADEQMSEFLASSDTWSRPVKAATGPDGALWVADMYRQVIEHPQWIPEEWQKRLNLRAGEDKGRIYRVYRKGERPGPLPNLAELSTAQLVQTLESPNGALRDLAQHMLVRRNDRAAVPLLTKLAGSASSPLARVHALWTLEGLQALEPELLHSALTDEDWHVQEQAVQLCEPRLNEHPELGERLIELAEHPQVRVRLQVALSLGEWNDPRAGAALGRVAAADLQNVWMRAAVLSSATPHAGEILAVVLGKAEPSEATSELAEHLIATALATRESGAREILSTITAPEGDEAQPWQMAALADFLSALDKRGTKLAAVGSADDPEFAALLAKVHGTFETARRLARDPQAELEDRIKAVRALGHDRERQADDLKLLAGLLTPQNPPALQSATLQTLAGFRSDAAPGLLLENWKAHAPTLRAEIVAVLLSRPKWTSALLEALQARRVAPADLEAAARSALVGHQDAKIRTRAEKLLKTGTSESRQAVLERYQTVLGMNGNLFRGAETFSRRCASCHRYRGRGRDLGPDLAALKDKTPQNLLVALFDPNRAVEGKYRSYAAVTKEGRVFNGLVVEEATGSITLAQPDGTQHVLLRADLEEFAGTDKSFMPEGLEQDLEPQNAADVIAFLQSAPPPAGAAPVPALQAQWEEIGASGYTQALTSGERKTAATWLGASELICCVGRPEKNTLEWQTAAVPKDINGDQPFLFRVAVALGGAAEQEFVLKVQDDELLRFAVPTGDASWKGQDSPVELRYLALSADDHGTSGVLEIELPGRMLEPEKPVRLAVVVPETAPSLWFGVIP